MFKLGDPYVDFLPLIRRCLPCDSSKWTDGGRTIGCARPKHEDQQHIYVENGQVREIWIDEEEKTSG